MTPQKSSHKLSERNIRDSIASDLDSLERGLTLVRVEFKLPNLVGAGGSIDILARDTFGHYVVIEIKKSNVSARQALHELSKYIVLLREHEGLGRDEIRCLLVSTEWHELFLPFSYFRANIDVDVRGVRLIVPENGPFLYQQIEPQPLQNLPTFSPDFSYYTYELEEQRSSHIDHMRSRAATIPFLRVAVVVLNPKPAFESTVGGFLSITCMWRIDDQYLERIENACGFKIGHLEPYAFTGWEPETDVLNWIESDASLNGKSVTSGWRQGTPEKVSSILKQFDFESLVHLGRDSDSPTLNDGRRILELLSGFNPRLPLAKHNAYVFEDVTSASNAKSWDAAVKSFLDFISLVPLWREQAEEFLNRVKDDQRMPRVILESFKKLHFFYAVHQAREFPEAGLSHFRIRVEDHDGKMLMGKVGMWSWDGTCPVNAGDEMARIYKSKLCAVVSVRRGGDAQTAEESLAAHGFHAVVASLDVNDSAETHVRVIPELGPEWTGIEQNPLHEFVTRKSAYAECISRELESFGPIPRQPGSGSFLIHIHPGER